MIYYYPLGIIFSFLYSVLSIYSTFCEDKRQMAKAQTIDQVFNAFSHLFLYSYSATVVNIVNIFRNYMTYKGKLNKSITIVLIFLYVILGIIFNSRGWIGIIPIIASSSYAVFCLKGKNVQAMRYGLIFNQMLWIIHDYVVKVYPSIVVEIFVIMTAMYNSTKYYQHRQKQSVKGEENGRAYQTKLQRKPEVLSEGKEGA